MQYYAPGSANDLVAEVRIRDRLILYVRTVITEVFGNNCDGLQYYRIAKLMKKPRPGHLQSPISLHIVNGEDSSREELGDDCAAPRSRAL